MAKQDDPFEILDPPAPAQAPESEEARDGRGNRNRDPELLAMERILRMLDELAPAGRARAVAYLADRFMMMEREA